MVKAQYTVSLYTGQHAAALDKFIDYFWPREDSATDRSNFLSQASAVEQGGSENRPPTFLFLRDHEVIGHITSLPVRLSTRSATTQAHWVVGFMVLPEHRNGLVGPCLIKKVNETLDLAMSLHVEDTVLRILKGMGWKHVGVIPQYLHILKVHRLFRNLQIARMSFLERHGAAFSRWLALILCHPLVRSFMAPLAALVLKLFSISTAFLRSRERQGIVTEEKGFDASYDALWNRVASKFDALVVRDREYLESRYGRQMWKYRLLGCRNNDDLLGYCVLKIKEFAGDPHVGNARIGTIVDCLFDPDNPAVFQSLFTASRRLFNSEHVDAIFCTASHLQLQKLLVRNAFIKVPGNLNFAYLDRGNSIRREVVLPSWHLMRGDSDADDNF